MEGKEWRTGNIIMKCALPGWISLPYFLLQMYLHGLCMPCQYWNESACCSYLTKDHCHNQKQQQQQQQEACDFCEVDVWVVYFSCLKLS